MLDLDDIEVEEIFINTKDYPDFQDSYIISAFHISTGLDLRDEELDKLNECGEYVYEQCLDRVV